MKKIIQTTVLVSVFSILTFSSVLAQNVDTQNKKEESRLKVEQLEEKQKRFEDKGQEKVGFFKSLLSIFVKTETETLKTKTLRNFDITIKNLENLSKRIESRIEKIEETGKDLTDSKNLLASSTVQIEIAKAEYKKLSEIIPDSFDKDSKKEIKEAVKEQTKNTKEAIQRAQNLLSDTISSIKPEETQADILTPENKTDE